MSNKIKVDVKPKAESQSDNWTLYWTIYCFKKSFLNSLKSIISVFAIGLILIVILVTIIHISENMSSNKFNTIIEKEKSSILAKTISSKGTYQLQFYFGNMEISKDEYDRVEVGEAYSYYKYTIFASDHKFDEKQIVGAVVDKSDAETSAKRMLQIENERSIDEANSAVMELCVDMLIIWLLFSVACIIITFKRYYRFGM